MTSLDSTGRVFAALVRASGRVPLLSLVLGPAAGGAAYGPALTDVVIMSPAARIFVTGPDVVRAVTGEQVDALSLGGPEQHGLRSGVAHLTPADEPAALAATRRLVRLLGPAPGAASRLDDVPALAQVVPGAPRAAYDVHRVVELLVDDPAEVVELHAGYARNLVTVLARLGGRTVGVLANNPVWLAGCLDAATSEKGARFVRMCDALGVPLLVLVDVPGYLPGEGQERDGIVRRGAKLLHAFADARVARVTVILRKAYGGAYIAMNSRALGATAVLAWPGAELGVMSATAAAEVLQRRHLAVLRGADRERALTAWARDYQEQCGGLDRAVQAGAVDAVIEPASTRRVVADALAGAPHERGRHRNMPL